MHGCDSVLFSILFAPVHYRTGNVHNTFAEQALHCYRYLGGITEHWLGNPKKLATSRDFRLWFHNHVHALSSWFNTPAKSSNKKLKIKQKEFNKFPPLIKFIYPVRQFHTYNRYITITMKLMTKIFSSFRILVQNRNSGSYGLWTSLYPYNGLTASFWVPTSLFSPTLIYSEKTYTYLLMGISPGNCPLGLITGCIVP